MYVCCISLSLNDINSFYRSKESKRSPAVASAVVLLYVWVGCLHHSFFYDTYRFTMARETGGGGGPGGIFPSGPHKFHFLGGTGGPNI